MIYFYLNFIYLQFEIEIIYFHYVIIFEIVMEVLKYRYAIWNSYIMSVLL